MKPARKGVSEMRIDHGPGYRIYFMQRGSVVVVLLAGGDKSTLDADIKTAIKIAKEWIHSTCPRHWPYARRALSCALVFWKSRVLDRATRHHQGPQDQTSCHAGDPTQATPRGAQEVGGTGRGVIRIVPAGCFASMVPRMEHSDPSAASSNKRVPRRRQRVVFSRDRSMWA